MSVTQVPLRPIARGSMLKLWLGLALIAAFAFWLARLGTAPLQSETTASGITFRTVAAGKGEPMTIADAALVEYVGTFDDGTVFDSSEQRGPQPMAPADMIPGFREAMLKMREGGRYHFRLPPELAYGSSPPPGMPANANLNFDVHIVKIGRNAAAMAAAQAQAQQQAQQQGGDPAAIR